MEGETQMAVEPGTHFGGLWGGVVVEGDVDGRADRHLGLDGVEEADKLLVAVPRHVLADDAAVEHVEGGKQRGRAVPLIVVRHGAEPSFFRAGPGWVRSSAWIWLFSSTDSTMAWAGGST